MILSMTGYGSARAEAQNLTVSIEAKTVNHRYLDLHVRLPNEFQGLESVVRQVVSARVRRGRVDVFVKIDLKRDRVRMEADPALIASYIDIVRDLQARFPITGELTVDAISRVPGAITLSNPDLTADEQDTVARHVEQAARAAFEQLWQMRRREGEALVADLESRIGNIRLQLETIRGGADALLAHHREQLTARVAELAPNLSVDSNRLEVEALMFAEKSDIAEEITRLGSHLDQFGGLVARDDESGKRMDFLLQEMNREVTTILSKTSGLNQTGAAIGEAAVEIKVEIDKLREQVQNIE